MSGGVLIGVDEAGYGPNLGPLVIVATRWRVESSPERTDLFETLSPVVSREKPRDPRVTWIADSKSVYNPSRGLADLERGALTLLSLLDGPSPADLSSLWKGLDPERFADRHAQPWYAGNEPTLPHVVNDLPLPAIERLREHCAARGVRLEAARARIVCPGRFNQRVAEAGTKGRMLSETTLELIAELVDDRFDESTLVLADKHGGRNQYREFLLPWVGDRLPVCLEEGGERSRYRAGSVEFRFQVRSEAHFPVAAASMLAKYVRELSMVPFNAWWGARVPGLAPTAGYPQDAKRFVAAIEQAGWPAELSREVVWRSR